MDIMEALERACEDVIAVKDLPTYLQDMLEGGEYKMANITPLRLLDEWAGWELGDPSWAGSFLNVLGEGLKARS